MPMLRGERRREAERGQSLVEMTIGLVILTMIVMGILDLGRIYFLYLVLEDAAAEGALYVSLNPSCPYPDTGTCANPRNAEYRAQYAAGNSYDLSGADVVFDIPNTNVGTVVTVTITQNYETLTPLISGIVRTIPMTVTARSIIARNN